MLLLAAVDHGGREVLPAAQALERDAAEMEADEADQTESDELVKFTRRIAHREAGEKGGRA